MKRFILSVLLLGIFLFSGLAMAHGRKIVYWDSDGPNLGLAVADDGSIWSLTYTSGCDINIDPFGCNYTCTKQSIVTLNNYSWVRYSSVSLPEGRRILQYFPNSRGTNYALAGRALMDDGTLWDLVSISPDCTCEVCSSFCSCWNDYSNFSNYNDNLYSWFLGAPALPHNK
jgi:hypothetical protein